MVDLTKERTAEICKQVNPKKDWTDADIEGLKKIASSDDDFPTEEKFVYFLTNLPKVLR